MYHSNSIDMDASKTLKKSKDESFEPNDIRHGVNFSHVELGISQTSREEPVVIRKVRGSEMGSSNRRGKMVGSQVHSAR